MDRNYGGFIWTNHSLQRLSERGISQGDAWATLRNPDESRYAQNKGTWVYYKTWGNQKIEVVAKQNERKEWIVLSVWSKPIFEGGGHVSGKPKKGDPSYVSPWGMIKSLFKKG